LFAGILSDWLGVNWAIGVVAFGPFFAAIHVWVSSKPQAASRTECDRML